MTTHANMQSSICQKQQRTQSHIPEVKRQTIAKPRYEVSSVMTPELFDSKPGLDSADQIPTPQCYKINQKCNEIA